MTTQTPNAKPAAKAAPAKPKSSLPEGFTKKISTSVEYFYRPQLESNGAMQTLQGYVLERRFRPLTEEDEKRGKTEGGTYYIVMLTKPLVAVHEENGETPCEPGTLVWVDERHETSYWVDQLPRRVDGMPTLSEVYFEPTKKKKLKGGRTMWQGTNGFQPIRGADILKLGLEGFIPERALQGIQQSVKALPSDATPTTGGEEIPF